MDGVHMTIENMENELQNNRQLYELMKEAINMSSEELKSIMDYLESKMDKI